MTEDTKVCVKCGEEQPLTNFYQQAGMRDGYRNDCKACMGKRRREQYRNDPTPFIRRTQRWRERHPERYEAMLERNRTVNKERRAEVNRRSHLRRKYGLSIEVYEFLCLVQSDRCAICGEEDEKLHVDHEHGTGRVRGSSVASATKPSGF